MIFATTNPRGLVLKASRPKWKRTRTRARAEALTQRMGSAVRVDLVNGIEKFKSKVNPELIYQAWKSANYHRVMETIPWNDLPGDLDPVADSLADGAFASGIMELKALPAPINRNLRYDVENPAIQDYFSRSVGTMVTGIQADAQQMIQIQSMRAFTEAQNPRQVAEQIKDSIGLLPKHAIAVRNYSRGLQDKGYPLDNIEKYTKAYADKLLNYRANMIARTEIQGAINQGQLSVWQEAIGQGYIDGDTARKIPVLDGDPCENCIQLAEDYADGLPIYESFLYGPMGDPFERPPFHPHCFCLMELDIGRTQDKTEDHTPEEYNLEGEED